MGVPRRRTAGALLLVLLVLVAAGACGPAAQGPPGPSPQAAGPPGALAYRIVEELSGDIGARVAGTPAERAAQAIIVRELHDAGYAPVVQPFTRLHYKSGKTVSSANVVAVKPGSTTDEIVLGAHYDSVAAGAGALDNASGVGLALELARRLRGVATPCTVRFMFFGGEEAGLLGSQEVVETMSADQRAATRVMIDLDSVAGGDELYVYGRPGDSWPRDSLLTWARRLHVPLRASRLADELFAVDPRTIEASGFGAASDGSVFHLAGLPYAGIESAALDVGSGKDAGKLNTRREGRIWNTARDTLPHLERLYPGRVEAQLRELVLVLRAFLTGVAEQTTG